MTFGGDFIMRSTDGGKNFIWSNSGYNGIMTGGHISLNVDHPDWIFNPSQDYNGGYTLNGGKTWTSLTRSVGDGREGPDGGREATAIRVNAVTREVFVGTCCRGMWKMAAPAEDKLQ